MLRVYCGLLIKRIIVINKNNFWGITLIYSVGFLSLRAISFLLLPIYTNLLNTKEAGYVFILYTIIAFFNTMYNHGMDSALLKFYKSDNSKTIITTSISYSFIYGCLLSILLCFFNQPLQYFSDVMVYTTNQLALFILIILLNNYINKVIFPMEMK